jgi:lipopolysaccharide/colanic/teichoic acid biosynthesis glycosyltransferase
MAVRAEAEVHRDHFASLVESRAPMIKIDVLGDARLIPGGQLMRATGLDELPQIINILRGEMSLVGPRPCIPYECEKYQPWHRERFDTLPGLTGLWQVSGKNRTTFEQMMQLDVKYVRTKSWWLDVQIILLTAPAILRQVWDARQRRKISHKPTP